MVNIINISYFLNNFCNLCNNCNNLRLLIYIYIYIFLRYKVITFSWGYFIWDELTACHNIKLSFKKKKGQLIQSLNSHKCKINEHFSLGANSYF